MVDGKSWKMVEKNWRNGRYRNFGEMEQETGSDWWSWLRPIEYFMLIEFNRKIGFRRKYICRNWKSNKMPNHCNSLMLQFSYICHVAIWWNHWQLNTMCAGREPDGMGGGGRDRWGGTPENCPSGKWHFRRSVPAVYKGRTLRMLSYCGKERTGRSVTAVNNALADLFQR